MASLVIAPTGPGGLGTQLLSISTTTFVPTPSAREASVRCSVGTRAWDLPEFGCGLAGAHGHTARGNLCPAGLGQDRRAIPCCIWERHNADGRVDLGQTLGRLHAPAGWFVGGVESYGPGRTRLHRPRLLPRGLYCLQRRMPQTWPRGLTMSSPIHALGSSHLLVATLEAAPSCGSHRHPRTPLQTLSTIARRGNSLGKTTTTSSSPSTTTTK